MASILKVDETFDHTLFAGSACAFGVFDGVHNGHRFLLNCACETAAATGGVSIALTFDIDPDEKFHPERLKKLMRNEDRIEMLAQSGVDIVAVLPFTDDFAASTPAQFLEKTFNGFVPAGLHVGCDFRFGARACGTVKELNEWGDHLGTTIYAHDLKSADGAPITATRIRLLLADTDIDEANKLLGRPYRLKERVLPGRGEGRDLGFRTANLKVEPMMQALGEGVYAAYATVGESRYKAAVAVGVSPVFEGRADATCEVHILDFSGDLYGQEIAVDFVGFLRPMIKFQSVEELVGTVHSNIEWVKQNL